MGFKWIMGNRKLKSLDVFAQAVRKTSIFLSVCINGQVHYQVIYLYNYKRDGLKEVRGLDLPEPQSMCWSMLGRHSLTSWERGENFPYKSNQFSSVPPTCPCRSTDPTTSHLPTFFSPPDRVPWLPRAKYIMLNNVCLRWNICWRRYVSQTRSTVGWDYTKPQDEQGASSWRSSLKRFHITTFWEQNVKSTWSLKNKLVLWQPHSFQIQVYSPDCQVYQFPILSAGGLLPKLKKTGSSGLYMCITFRELKALYHRSKITNATVFFPSFKPVKWSREIAEGTKKSVTGYDQLVVNTTALGPANQCHF